MLNGSEIVSCVTRVIPEVKEAKWRQDKDSHGYFICDYKGSRRSILVEVNSSYVVFNHLDSREIAVAIDIIKHLRGE